MRKIPRATPSRAHGQLWWSCALLLVPLGSGLAVNYTVGWWPGLAAFLVAGVLTGRGAYRAEQRSRSTSPVPDLRGH
jgi:hypothetical protein